MKVTINEKEYGLHWGMGAIEIYCDAMETDLATALDLLAMPNKDQNKATVNLFLAALQNYAEINDLQFDLNYRKLQAWLDEADPNTVSTIVTDFNKSKYLGRTMYEHFGVEDPDNAVQSKKKSPSGKSLNSPTK